MGQDSAKKAILQFHGTLKSFFFHRGQGVFFVKSSRKIVFPAYLSYPQKVSKRIIRLFHCLGAK